MVNSKARCFTVIVTTVLLGGLTHVQGNKCDECSTKTYCLSTDFEGKCSKKNLVVAEISVPQEPSDPGNVLILNLKGYNIKEKEDQVISLTIRSRVSSSTSTTYNCNRSSLGSTSAEVTHNTSVYSFGSSYYSNGVLQCKWVIGRNDQYWPLAFETPADFISSKDFFVHIQHGDRSVKVAADTSEFPHYKLQYLKCCSNVYSNDNLVISFKTLNDSVQYLIQTMESSQASSSLKMKLTNPDGTKLIYNCAPDSNSVKGTVSNVAKSSSIDGQISVVSVLTRHCVWMAPSTLSTSAGQFDTLAYKYDMQISNDHFIIFTAPEVSLKSSALSTLSSVSMILVLAAMSLVKLTNT